MFLSVLVYECVNLVCLGILHLFPLVLISSRSRRLFAAIVAQVLPFVAFPPDLPRFRFTVFYHGFVISSVGSTPADVLRTKHPQVCFDVFSEHVWSRMVCGADVLLAC